MTERISRAPRTSLTWRNRRGHSPSSFWSGNTRRWFDAARDIPWAAATTFSVVLGTATLSIYFRSIEFFPSDLAAITALAVATTAEIAVLIGSAGIALFAPSILAVMYVEATPPGSRTPYGKQELLATQLLGVCGFMAYTLYDFDCGRPTSIWFYACVSAAFGFLTYLARVFLVRIQSGTRVVRILHSAMITCLSPAGPSLR